MKKYFCLSSFLNFINRNRLFTSITVFGFSISLMFALILGLYVYNEFTIDRERANYDRIHFLKDNFFSIYSYRVGDQLLEGVPEIEKLVRMGGIQFRFKLSEASDALQAEGFLADTTIFSVLSFAVVEGDKQKPIPNYNSVSISKAFADKWYSGESAIGKVLLLDFIRTGYQPYTITSVFEDVKNSGFNSADMMFDMELAGIVYNQKSFKTSHNSFSYDIFLLEKKGADLSSKVDDFQEILPDFMKIINEMKVGFDINEDHKFYTQKLGDDYFAERGLHQSSQVRASNSTMVVFVLLSVSLLLLVFSVINYINLSVAQIGLRAKEFATRRLLGATKIEVFMSFIIESFVLCVISFFVALLLTNLSLPLFNSVMHSDLSLSYLLNLSSISFILALILLISLISGVFPAYRILSFKAIDITKGVDRVKNNKFAFSKILMFVQFFIASVLLSGTIVMFSQLRLINSSDLGFAHENRVMVAVGYNNRKLIYEALNRASGVEGVGKALGLPIFGGSRNGTNINDSEQRYMFRYMVWDKAVMDMFDLKKAEVFDESDADGVWFDEYTWNTLPINKSNRKIKLYGKEQNIKGVLKDFKYYDVTAEREMLYIRTEKDVEDYYAILAKLPPNNIPSTIDNMRKEYSKISNGDFLDIKFFSEGIANLYRKQNQMATVVGAVSIASIVLSVMGIFAMSLYFIRQRKKEIAVRKIFGSTVSEITMKLFKSSVIIVAISFVASIPVTCYFMSDWLAQFSYNVGLQWYYFLAAAAILFVFSVLSVLWHTLKAATDNPIKTINDR